jgi:hypothetical protein
MIRLISWNISGKDLWARLGFEQVDVALLQEARLPPKSCTLQVIPATDLPWGTTGLERRAWRTAIARVSERVRLNPVAITGLENPDGTALASSRPGTITAADVVVGDEVAFTAVSMYAVWERPMNRDRPIFADSSAHRLLSDLSVLAWSRRARPIIAAGDLNILFGYGEHGSTYWGGRYATVFKRAEAIGLAFIGPQYPNGRQAQPWPKELPRDSRNVPTYHTPQQRPAGATRQLDFVFASEGLKGRVEVRALNEIADWGSSDHCRVIIDVDP